MKINVFDLSNEELVAYMLSILDEMCIRGMQKGCVEETYQRLKQENEELRKFKKQLLHTVILPNIDEPKVINKYKQALEKIRGNIDRCFKKKYMELGFNEYDELIEKIDKKLDEVLNEK